MRKLHVILSASLIVLAASCGKDPKPAAPMTPTQVQEKLSATEMLGCLIIFAAVIIAQPPHKGENNA